MTTAIGNICTRDVLTVAAGDAALLGGATLLLWFALGLLAVGDGAPGAHRPRRFAAG